MRTIIQWTLPDLDKAQVSFHEMTHDSVRDRPRVETLSKANGAISHHVKFLLCA